MSNCDFCGADLNNDGKTFTQADMQNIMAPFPTMGDFTKHYGFPNIILTKMYKKFNMKNEDSITLCPECSGKLSNG
jgi:hypothetical protein